MYTCTIHQDSQCTNDTTIKVLITAPPVLLKSDFDSRTEASKTNFDVLLLSARSGFDFGAVNTVLS